MDRSCEDRVFRRAWECSALWRSAPKHQDERAKLTCGFTLDRPNRRRKLACSAFSEFGTGLRPQSPDTTMIRALGELTILRLGFSHVAYAPRKNQQEFAPKGLHAQPGFNGLACGFLSSRLITDIRLSCNRLKKKGLFR